MEGSHEEGQKNAPMDSLDMWLVGEVLEWSTLSLNARSMELEMRSKEEGEEIEGEPACASLGALGAAD